MMRLLLLGIIIAASSSFCGGRGGSLFPTVGASSASAASSSSSSSSSSLWRQQQLAHLHHHHHHHHHHQHQLPISPLLYRRSNYSISNNDNNNNSDLVYSLKSLRGGAAAAAAALLQDDDDDYIDESDIDLLDIEQHQQGDEDNDTEEDDDDDDDDAPSTTTTTTTNANTLPIKIHITTGLNSPLLDQHIEFTASPKRSLHSIKQAISKTMPGRPPISCIQLRHRGRLLLDDNEGKRGYGDSRTMTVNDILSLDNDDDDDDIEDNNNNEDNDEDDEDSIKLSLTCDILPPIDSKFGIEFRNKIVSLSTKEIIEAYCLNMAGMMYGQEEQCISTSSSLEGKNEDDDDEENNNAPTATITPATATIGKDNPSLNIRKRAAFLQKQLFDTMFTEETKQLIEEEHARVMKKKMVNNNVDGVGRDEQEAAARGQEDEGEVVFGLISPTSRSNAHRSGGRKGGGSKGGATMNVKKALQKNLNVVR